MRTENIEVKFTIPIPINRPDGNGVIYTKEAIEKAIDNFNYGMPIIYRDDVDSLVDNAKVVGFTKSFSDVTWDDENQVCKMTLDGVVFYGGTDCVFNEIKDGIVKDFRITSVGLSG